MTGAAITGWGTALPERVVTNADIGTLFETSDDWIVERSGIHTRRAVTGPFVAEQPPAHPDAGLGTTATLAVEAGRQAMQRAGVAPGDIGLLPDLLGEPGLPGEAEEPVPLEPVPFCCCLSPLGGQPSTLAMSAAPISTFHLFRIGPMRTPSRVGES